MNNNLNSFLNEEQEKKSNFSLLKNKDKEMSRNLNRIRESLNSYYNEEEEVNNSPISYYFNESSNYTSYIKVLFLIIKFITIMEAIWQKKVK